LGETKKITAQMSARGITSEPNPNNPAPQVPFTMYKLREKRHHIIAEVELFNS
jgi:hypothetical protein